MKYSSILMQFQSYQFMQINPDENEHKNEFNFEHVSIVSIHADQSRLYELVINGKTIYGFNRINSCRSIPTQKDFWKL